MIYITGDTHGSYSRIRKFCHRQKSSIKDIMIVLGDTMMNYFLDERDIEMKEKVAKIPVTFLMIHGNHDRRPTQQMGYRQTEWMGGKVLVQEQYPHILFAVDGEVYKINGRTVLTVGGAYSVDKEYRIAHGYHWFADEQPSPEIQQSAEQVLAEHQYEVDTVLTHTCPLKYLPAEALFDTVDQALVDQSTERWLDMIEQKIVYRHWYCGHFHIDKVVDRMNFLFHDIIMWST